jgi:two-component system, OmpR family, phosphate regulon sensor histidine kinase PhoR
MSEWAWPALVAILVIALGWYALNLSALTRWLRDPRTPHPPRSYGGWDGLHGAIVASRRDLVRRQAELEESLKRWQEAARALPDGVVILDNDRIEWLNDIARLHLNLDLARDAGRPITHLLRIPAFLQYMEKGDFSRPLLVDSPQGDGRVISIQAVHYAEWQRLLLSRDVTQFQRVEGIRRDFVANVSHELRTPLTVVSGFIETLRDETDAAAAKRYLDLMSDQASRMQRLVEDLLTLSALESSPLPRMDERVAMQTLVERLAAEARALSSGRHRIEVQSTSSHDLMGNEGELASAFGNLVTNAIRYTPGGGSVTLRWRDDGDQAVFEVEDSGIGIAPEHIPRLTERFYRVDRGRSRETGGTGLGLAIVKHALVRHGATLHIASDPGRGSTFAARFAGPRVKPG